MFWVVPVPHTEPRRRHKRRQLLQCPDSPSSTLVAAARVRNKQSPAVATDHPAGNSALVDVEAEPRGTRGPGMSAPLATEGRPHDPFETPTRGTGAAASPRDSRMLDSVARRVAPQQVDERAVAVPQPTPSRRLHRKTTMSQIIQNATPTAHLITTRDVIPEDPCWEDCVEVLGAAGDAIKDNLGGLIDDFCNCLLYTSPSPRDS